MSANTRIVAECYGCGKIKSGKTCKVIIDPLRVWECYGYCWARDEHPKWEQQVRQEVKQYAEARGLMVKFKNGDVEVEPIVRTA